MGAHRRNTTIPRGTQLILWVCAGFGFIGAALMFLTLILIAVNGNFWGLLIVPCGAVIGFAVPRLTWDILKVFKKRQYHAHHS
jgi:hypothetical protein